MPPVRAKKAPGKKVDAPVPEPKTITQTPSGIEIAYFVEPKRIYKVRKSETCNQECAIQSTSCCSGEMSEWAEVPSVTTVLKCLDKPALSWWGMRVGFKAVNALWNDGFISSDAEGRLLVSEGAVWQYADFSDGGNVEQVIKQRKLTVNDTLAEAADRGTAVHDALEAWAVLGKLPDPNEFPPEEHAYSVALRQFCDDMGDAWETGGVEVAVASAEHGFAGRYDVRGTVKRDVQLVKRVLTKDGKSPLVKGPEYTTIPAGSKLLIDAKTSKSIYNTHLLQLEAYEGAGVECGYDPTDFRAVLHLSGHGLYQFKRATVSFDDFLAILHTYHALARVEAEL